MRFRTYPIMLAAWVLGLAPANALACDVTTPTNVSVGSHSPAALKAAAVPLTPTLGGFSCSSANILTLLSGNFLKATVPADTVLKLSSATTADTVPFKLYADAAGTNELKPGTEAYYINGTLLNLLNLFGNGAIDVPVHFKLATEGYVAPGTYTGSFSIRWDWYFCSGIGLLGLCIGAPDSGGKSATVNVTLTVAHKPPTVMVETGVTLWNPIEGILNPKAIPRSKRRISVTITNTDIVPLEPGVLKVQLPTPNRLAIVLDGDGTGLGPVIQTRQGNPASGLTLSYAAPGSTTDDVDFSSDGGATWGHLPVAGDSASQGAVTHVRFRPAGNMAPQSSLTISLPYSLK
ncbi:spore coat protein U domain-containing protein [Sphingomonas sp. AOB5]|uniref:spore coat protein U domain-containing protein n=1 Tax=Sphingomonas sp. AOB5 TaxID=3034017 RepID=UPI0023F6D3E2|nr:spore coat protein U domain-containing protein [Sphingomonas sp. AOB5]MDF7774300.1 spore coat protein U domain-containing protein [Sphingomonas sp. AOB5]